MDKQKFIDGTQKFTPKGKTPIAHSLEYTAKQFSNNDAVNSIVLISDGVETCGGDPCAAVKSLRGDQGLNIDFHVIGFDLNEEDQKHLQCIAEEGNGKFITANNTQALEDCSTSYRHRRVASVFRRRRRSSCNRYRSRLRVRRGAIYRSIASVNCGENAQRAKPVSGPALFSAEGVSLTRLRESGE